VPPSLGIGGEARSTEMLQLSRHFIAWHNMSAKDAYNMLDTRSLNA